MFILPFYLFNVVEFLIRLLQYKNWHKAYKNMSFERETYYNESNSRLFKATRILVFFEVSSRL